MKIHEMDVQLAKLTPKQQKLWDDTRAALVWSCPAFAHIFFHMMVPKGLKDCAYFIDDPKIVPIAATDGASLLLNPSTFFTYDMYERVFICAHEILHCTLDHICGMVAFKRKGFVHFSDGTKAPYIHELMNRAQDYIINDTLIQSSTGKFNKDWLHDINIATFKDSAIDTYQKLYKDAKAKGKIKEVAIAYPGQFDKHLDPGTSQGKSEQKAVSDRSQAEWDTAVAAATASAKAQGKLPQALELALGAVLEPKVDWKDKIRSLFARKVGGGGYDFQRPDEELAWRDIYAPSRSGHGAGLVVVGGDTSGSVVDELDMFLAEMSGILSDVRPRQLLIMWCDAKLQRVDEADDPSDLNTIRHKGAPGGGGTSFVPVFDAIDELGVVPDALVYLTDGHGRFPSKAPNYPVIWGSTSKKEYPFGDVVMIPKQAKQS